MTTIIKTKKQTWETVRRWYNYPPLREPGIVPELEGGARFDFSSGDIQVGESYVTQVVEKTGILRDECLEGILTHEVGHYMVFPSRLSTIILAGKMLDDFFSDKGKKITEFIFQTYADMNTDAASVLDSNRRGPILRMRTASQQIMPDELNKNVRDVMLAYLYRQAGRPYELSDELKSYLERMLQIEFLSPETNRPPQDAQKMRLSLFQFGGIINDIIDKYKPPQMHGAQGEGESTLDVFVFGTPRDLDIEEIINRASRGEIKRALREISEQVSRGEYKQVREWLKEKGIELPSSSKEGKDFSIGTLKGEIKIDQEVVDYYKELSKRYPLIVHKKPIPTETTRKSFQETEKWRVGQEPLLAMPYLSGGIFLPGITRQIKIKERYVKTTDYEIPHLLVVVDSSGSMPDPKDRKSHAVLAGFCAARSYHVQDSAVGVINFSGDSFYLPYTRTLDDILGAIAAYQGGGTSVDVEMLKKMLSPEEFKIYEEYPDVHIGNVPRQAIKKEIELSFPSFKKALESGSIDLLMLTDGGIANLDEVLGFVEENQGVNRGTIILTDHYKQFVPQMKSDKINIYRVEKDEDIPHIVLGDVRRNLNYQVVGYESQRK